jgi:peptidoglycan-N-acetylglucosamine deacetylase
VLLWRLPAAVTIAGLAGNAGITRGICTGARKRGSSTVVKPDEGVLQGRGTYDDVEGGMARQQHQVTFVTTFDYDAETIWKQFVNHGARTGLPSGRGPSFESSGTFGPKVGIWRVLDLLQEYEVPATFFTPGWTAEKHPRTLEAILERGHEVALHGYLHEFMDTVVDIEEERMILERGIKALKTVGVTPAGYRPGAYIYTEWSLQVMRELGFRYGSAMQDDDGAYIHPGSGTPIVEIPVLWHLTDDLYGWHMNVNMPPSHVEEHWLTELRALGRYPDRIYVPTMHPQVIGHPGRLEMFERVLQTGKELNVRFARAVDVADELLARGK